MAGSTSQNGFKDTILICVQCHEEFVFTASAQQYFAERGFHEPPKRCKACYTEFKHNGRTDAEPPRQGPDNLGRPDPPSPPRTAP